MSKAFNNIQKNQKNTFFLDNQKEMIFHFLQKGEIIFVNDAFCNYFCNKREELIGSNYNRFIYKPDKELVKNHLYKLCKSSPEVNIEYRVITIDGRIKKKLSCIERFC